MNIPYTGVFVQWVRIMYCFLFFCLSFVWVAVEASSVQQKLKHSLHVNGFSVETFNCISYQSCVLLSAQTAEKALAHFTVKLLYPQLQKLIQDKNIYTDHHKNKQSIIKSIAYIYTIQSPHQKTQYLGYVGHGKRILWKPRQNTQTKFIFCVIKKC